jgi:hypothetical protein
MFDRVGAYFHDVISPQITRNKKVVIVGHGSSLKAIINILEGIPEKVEGPEIIAGVPLVYELNEKLKAIKSYSLESRESEMGSKIAEDTVDKTTTEGKNSFWSKEMREMQIYSADQIIVPEDAPTILKNYCKEVIRANPSNIVVFSKDYFEKILINRKGKK